MAVIISSVYQFSCLYTQIVLTCNGPLVICISHHYYFVTSVLLFSVCNYCKLEINCLIPNASVWLLFLDYFLSTQLSTLATHYDVIFLFFFICMKTRCGEYNYNFFVNS